jgi:hypothetical protein
MTLIGGPDAGDISAAAGHALLNGVHAAKSRGQSVKGLKEAELKMAAEIAMEIANGRGHSFDVRATALALAGHSPMPAVALPLCSFEFRARARTSSRRSRAR